MPSIKRPSDKVESPESTNSRKRAYSNSEEDPDAFISKRPNAHANKQPITKERVSKPKCS